MKSVVLLSGGLDSAVLLASVKQNDSVIALSVDYGQRHRRELWSAFQVARYYGAKHEVVVLPPELFAGSSLTGGCGGVEGQPTVVPGRNLVLASLGVVCAVRNGAERVLLAANADDDLIYPDCRERFVTLLSGSTERGYGVQVEAPFVSLSKRDVVVFGHKLQVPFDLTWSCYDPQDYDADAPASGTPCGKCGACELRMGVGG